MSSAQQQQLLQTPLLRTLLAALSLPSYARHAMSKNAAVQTICCLPEASINTFMQPLNSILPAAQVPGGWAAQRWGGRRMLTVSFGLWSTASMLTPGSASSQAAIMLARVAVGVAQGFLIPSVHTVLSQVLPHSHALMPWQVLVPALLPLRLITLQWRHAASLCSGQGSLSVLT